MDRIHVCYAVKKECINPDSYGMICVHCGCCSTDKMTRYSARLKMFTEHLKEHEYFNNWIKGHIRLQKSNMKKNITYCKRRIAIYYRLFERSIEEANLQI